MDITQTPQAQLEKSVRIAAKEYAVKAKQLFVVAVL
jgi:hypothetical protein